MPKKGKVLGIDYGDARIGLAISDEDQIIAFPKETIQNTSFNEGLRLIKEICDKERIVKIVIGMPFSLDGSKKEQAVKTEEFGNLLKETLKIPLIYHDERLTSVESDDILSTLNMRGTERKLRKDTIAASLILKNYLDLVSKREKREGKGSTYHDNNS